MISASNKWKEIMNRPIRNRAFISVGIGIINQNAQASGKVSGNFAYWSYGDVLDTNKDRIEYATMEDNFMKADGSMYFMPENDELMQLNQNGITTEGFSESIRIDFSEIYAIKGITIVFASAYPESFILETAEKTITYENDSEKFVTNDVIGDTNYIIITPRTMVGGQQRLRIKSILMGVGLQYSNQQTKSFSIDDYASSISEYLPSKDMSFSFYDEEDLFDVDDDNSFIDFLKTMQKITVSFGMEMDDGEVEWHQIATQYLKNWKSQKGVVSIDATDRLAQMEDEYTLANRIYDRTAYEEAENIFKDAGLEPDEYYIDDYLNDIKLHNPMPDGTHKECLQILANACRCAIKNDENGVIKIVANFAVILDPEDLSVEANQIAEWGTIKNIFAGANVTYADMTEDFMKADGSMYFLPEDKTYLETSYVSKQIGDIYGNFEENPKITITLPAAYTYYGLNIKFDGNAPKEMIVHTYINGNIIDQVTFYDMENESYLFHEFTSFDKMVIEITKGYPCNHVLINKISYSSLSDYTLTKSNMLEKPIGYKEKRVKSVKVKIYTYQLDEKGEVQEIEDDVYYEKVLGDTGDVKTLENPLVNTEEHAELLGEWIGNHYMNNISYDVKFRGEPRINATDIIRMDSEKVKNLQVEVERNRLEFNGIFSGELELRKALKLMEE